MEKFILEQIALELISKLKEINSSIKELENKLSLYQRNNSNSIKLDINKLNRTIAEKLKAIITLSETKFILPDKLIDNILMIFIKLLDIIFINKQSDHDKYIITNEILPLISKFINIKQNYQTKITRSEFITGKWKYLENILKYSLSFIDILDNSENGVNIIESSHLASILNLIDLIYFDLDSVEYKYKIMPGLISKILKILNVLKHDVKIPNKLWRLIIKIFDENVNVIFKYLQENLNYNSNTNFLHVHTTNFISFFEFYNAFHIKLQERSNRDKLVKILPNLLQMNLNSAKKLSGFKSEIIQSKSSDFKFDFENVENYFRNVLYFLTKLVDLEKSEIFVDILNKEFFESFSNLFQYEEISEKFHQDINSISRMISRDELNLSKDIIRNLFIHMNFYLIKVFSDKTKCQFLNIDENFVRSNFTLNNFLNEENSKSDFDLLTPFNIILEKILEKQYELRNNIILEVVNTFEIHVKNTSLEKTNEKFMNLLDQCFKHSVDNEFIHLRKIIKATFDFYPEIRKYFLNSIFNKLNIVTRKFKKFVSNNIENENEKGDLIKKFKDKEFQSEFDSVLQIFSLFISISTYEINFAREKLEKNDIFLCKLFTQKQKIILKNITNFFCSILLENQEDFGCINKIKISLMNSLLMMMYGYLLHISKMDERSLFTNQELNNILIFALPNYCNRTGILKYSSLFLLNIMISHKNYNYHNEHISTQDENELNLKNFVFTNFDFVINTTIKKIIYFNENSSVKKIKNNSVCNKYMNSHGFLSNFKLDLLNLFNSLILLLEEFEEENILNFYCGELLKFIKKLFNFFDLFTKEKNFFALECLLEIIEKITTLQKNVIERNYELFKSNSHEDYIISEIDQDRNKFVSFLKEKVGIDDSNLFRNIILRILPLFFSNKISIMFKSLKIIENLISTLFLLPMTREEKANFSTEDNSNVLVKSSLGPVMFEAWGYFVFILQIKNSGNISFKNENKNFLNQNINLYGNFFNFFIKVFEYYPSFFNETRVFGELLTIMEDNLKVILESFTNVQIIKAYLPMIVFIEKIMEIKFEKATKHHVRQEYKEKLLNFLRKISELTFRNKPKQTEKTNNSYEMTNSQQDENIKSMITRIIIKLEKLDNTLELVDEINQIKSLNLSSP